MRVIEFNQVSKLYRLGRVSSGTLSDDLNRWWAMKVLGKEDPLLRVGEKNVPSQKGMSDYVWALKDFSYCVQEGDALGIIGRNGAGKSTLLKLLSRITTPTAGEIKVHGRIASLLEVGTGFHPELTGRENIYMNGAIMGMTKAEITRKLDEIIDFSGCERYIDTPVKRYSSGMRVRLGFSVAAHLEPEILVIDEVLSVGDADFRKKATGKIQQVSKGEGRTVLFVSHNMGLISSLCTKGIVLRNGVMDFSGTAAEAIDHYQKVSTVKIAQQALIIDCIDSCKSIVEISEIQINNTPYSSSALTPCQQTLDVMIKGTTHELIKCEIKMVIKKSNGTPMASFLEGRYKGFHTVFQPGEFTITRHIRLPKYIANGEYLIDLYLHGPYVQNFFEAHNCHKLSVDGFCDQLARPIEIGTDGFIGLESV